MACAARCLRSRGVPCQSRQAERGDDGLQVPGQSAEALLLMHARTSQDDPAAPVLYCARMLQA